MDTFIKTVREDGTVEYVNSRYNEIVSMVEERRSKQDLTNLPILTQEELDADLLNNVHQRRILEYPPLTDFADAWVKQDETALEEYRQACLAVKAKYPKP